jgi:transposase
MLDGHQLPDDVAVLKAMILDREALIDARDAVIKSREARIEALEAQLALLKRRQFGKSSEKLDRAIAQLELALEELREDDGAALGRLGQGAAPTVERAQPKRAALPEHLPTEDIVHAAPDACPACGGALRPLGEDVREELEYVPASFRRVRHVRPKLSCRSCETIVQAPPASSPIPKGKAGPGLLAHVLVSKYCDHLPLYRQSGIYAREGVDLERSTLADWVGRCSALMEPLITALGRHALAGAVVHGDDTPVPVLDPGAGKTKTGRLWVYVRDERPHASKTPPAAYYRYSPDRKGEHPQGHLKSFKGVLQADGYAGFNELYRGDITEAACWAHARRKFFDICVTAKSETAEEALMRIGELYAIEDAIRGRPPDERRAVRQTRSAPILNALKPWLEARRDELSRKSELAKAIGYALSRWTALTRFLEDGRLSIDNNAAERAIRGIALGRKNYLFAGSDSGGVRAAAIYSLVETAKLNGLDPEKYLRDVLVKIADHPINQIDALLPWRIYAPN